MTEKDPGEGTTVSKPNAPEIVPAADAEPDSSASRQTEAAPATDSKAYAIIQTGGKQYRVRVGDRISVERLAATEGSDITLDRVLLVGGDGSTRVGTPTVAGAAVNARVEDHFRGEKIVVFKYKPKQRYRRRLGHRQALTHLTITTIGIGG